MKLECMRIDKITRQAQALLSRLSIVRKHFCVLCGHHLSAFLPYRAGIRPPLMNTLDVVGSDVEHFECPWCGCHDRERHLFLYMNACGLLPDLSGKTVVHFAPERQLSHRILDAGPMRYIKCDLFPQTSDVMRVNLLNMPFADNSVDLLIANHVLEHVSDDAKALREIVRILKPGGYAILQTPYSSKLEHTWSDPGINSDEERLQAYGQEDHVRLYGRNIFNRFESFGLTDCVQTHRDALHDISALRYGVNEAEPFFLFQRLAISVGPYSAYGSM